MSRPLNAVLIVAGGMVGTVLRASLEAAAPAATGGWPWTTFWINVVGSALLAILLEWLAVGEDVGWRRSMRLGVGTGLIGGFTTYSAFAVETVTLLSSGQWALGVGYAVASPLAGIAAAVAAIAVLRRLRPSVREAR